MFAQAGPASRPAKQPTQAPAAPSAALSPHDLTGVWNARIPTHAPLAVIMRYVSTFGNAEPSMTPEAEALYKASKPSFGPRGVTMEQTNDPVYKCYPPGVPRVYLHPFPVQILQTPKEVVMLFEYDHQVRHIYVDGRPHPKDLEPTWMGHSIGHWEGDTLVVDSIGFNDKTWLDRVGHPHSDQLHLIERMRRTDPNTLQIDLHIEDPKDYTQPIDSQLIFSLKPDWDIMEQVCMDNSSFLNFENNETKGAESK